LQPFWPLDNTEIVKEFNRVLDIFGADSGVAGNGILRMMVGRYDLSLTISSLPWWRLIVRDEGRDLFRL
jgi:hypothetical protein